MVDNLPTGTAANGSTPMDIINPAIVEMQNMYDFLYDLAIRTDEPRQAAVISNHLRFEIPSVANAYKYIRRYKQCMCEAKDFKVVKEKEIYAQTSVIDLKVPLEHVNCFYMVACRLHVEAKYVMAHFYNRVALFMVYSNHRNGNVFPEQAFISMCAIICKSLFFLIEKIRFVATKEFKSSYLYHSMKYVTDALAACCSCIKGAYLAEVYHDIASNYYFYYRLDETIHWCEVGMARLIEYQPQKSLKLAIRGKINHKLSLCYARKGSKDLAIKLQILAINEMESLVQAYPAFKQEFVDNYKMVLEKIKRGEIGPGTDKNDFPGHF